MSGIPTPTFPTASGGTPKPMTAAGTIPTTKTTASGTTPQKPNFTRIDHHFDGSHTVSHEYDDPAKNISYAKADLSGVNDGLDQHVG